MDRLAIGTLVRETLRVRRAELRLCLRTTVAGLSALALTGNFPFPLHGLWTVLTAVVVTQVSVGGSLRATIEYMIGTLGGAVYAAVLGVLVPHQTLAGQVLVLALAIAPLALAAAINPSFRVAPFSAVLVLLIGGAIGQSPIESALTRILEVALGGLVAVVVSIVVLPERAHRLGLNAAAQTLGQMADVLPRVLSGFSRAGDAGETGRLMDELRGFVTALQDRAAEARRERLLPFGREPDPAALARTLLRPRNDLVMLRRAGAAPLPDVFAERLAPLLTRFGDGVSAYLREGASELGRRQPPPPLDEVEASLQAFESEVASLRAEGLTRTLSTPELERLFALGFALEQLRQNLSDLALRLQEFAGRA